MGRGGETRRRFRGGGLRDGERDWDMGIPVVKVDGLFLDPRSRPSIGRND